MSLFSQWESKLKNQHNPANERFFENYLEKEKEAYRKILETNTPALEGKLSDLAAAYNMDITTFMGFLDGINTSLDAEVDLESLEEESELNSKIDFEKLYYNMLGAKAHWLHGLKEWDNILSTEQRLAIKKQYNEDHRAVSNKVGRNDPCPCGSGKKYKKCCGA